MKHELWYSVVVRDRHGKVLSRERRKSRSFLKQWNQLVYVQTAGLVLSITDIGGVARGIAPHDYNFNINAPAGTTNTGIRVGTGNTPVDISDFQLDTPIDEGLGAGQMEHLICTVAASVVAAPSCSFLVSRAIANSSGAGITVREAAIYMNMGATFFSCATRDVLTVPQAVPDGGSITIDWTIGVTI